MIFFGKSADKNGPGESEQWKAKYLNLLDTHEQSEKKYKEQQDVLCKTILRLIIVADEVGPQLEPNLQRIRDNLKNGLDSQQLKTELASLTQAIHQLQGTFSKGRQQSAASPLLFDFLFQRYTSHKQQKELARLKASYQPQDNPQRLFSFIANIIDDDEMTDKKTARQPCQTSSSIQQPIDTSIICSQLLKLLEKITIPEAFVQKTQSLKQQLETREAANSPESMLDGVISLLIEINGDNQSNQLEIDKFLAHITGQLTALGSAISGSGSAFLDASQSRTQLDQSVSEQMNELQYRSLHATQLEPLKEIISLRIAKITQEIQEHKQQEEDRFRKHQQQMEALNNKISQMEAETGVLKSKLVTVSTRALRDTLTGLPNRLAYDDRLKNEIANWERYHTPLCLLVWDVDFFKKINDKLGHQVGDAVLAHVARQLSEHIRQTDFVARFGGEEFVMLLPHANKQSAFKTAEKLRDLIEQNQLTINNMPLGITISCGITEFVKGDTHELAFARADKALYRAKKSGRNRCCLA